MAKAIVVLEDEVAELFTKVKNSSTGLPRESCDKTALAMMVGLRLVRIQSGNERRPDRVKLAENIDEFDVRIRQ